MTPLLAVLLAAATVGPPAPKVERFTTVSHDAQPASSRVQLSALIIAPAALDYWTTQRARAIGLAESNPVMGDGGTVLAVGKVAASAVYVVGVPYIERRNPKVGRLVKWGVPLAWCAASAITSHTRARALAQRAP
jgi:hypothetical protein